MRVTDELIERNRGLLRRTETAQLVAADGVRRRMFETLAGTLEVTDGCKDVPRTQTLTFRSPAVPQYGCAVKEGGFLRRESSHAIR